MISFADDVFKLNTITSSYWFRVTKVGHLEHIYYGRRLPDDQTIEPLLLKRTAQLGSSVMYDQSDETYCLDNICLEWSGIGKGDYRNAPAQIKMPDGTFTADFVYQSHQTTKGNVTMDKLPASYGSEDSCETLEIALIDQSNNVHLLLYYTVYPKVDVISRRTVLKNRNPKELAIRSIMSMSLDIPNQGFRLVTFNGGWIKEGHKQEERLGYGIYVNSSTTGDSSNRHNPGFLLASSDATESVGSVYGFNLVYSGNHYGSVELSNHDLVRIQLGINPYCFEWVLNQDDSFETPEAFMSYSADGYNGLSHHFHDFINEHIVRSEWKGKERPVLLNNWEAHFFKFTRGKLLKLARRAKKVGIELFVLDDGWFGNRDSDKAGLGDYTINRKKLPRGLDEFSKRIHKMEMKFGIWFEPEMLNEDSELYRSHPEYALRTPNKNPALGRNQMVLDLCNEKVRDYIVQNVTHILDTCDIDYVKWDYNRHISDACSIVIENQGEFFHRYILGLYDVLERIFRPRPHILFESCSSGGNRFDAGMLCYSPQVWTSDDTDSIERLKIQGGMSYLYPLSTMGAHVSQAPHQQTLRNTPLSTRFNVAAFGCLGYELDLKYLSHVQRKEVKSQISFYRKYRSIMQYGRFYRGEEYKSNKVVWHCVDPRHDTAVTGFFQTQTTASEGFDRLTLMGLKAKQKYTVKTKPQSLYIKSFGGLVKHILPITLNPDGIILRIANQFFCLTDCVEAYTAYGQTLMDGVLLNNQFVGSYYNDKIRLLGDGGSSLYITQNE
ncbi:MAG: alpha-galactosidase [Clostridiales bacterium]|nr:alpha-galactosidase [Clostridiales bacterium]